MDVLRLPDGKLETIFVREHFEQLIDTYIGSDAAKYFHNLIESHDAELEKLYFARKDIEGWVLENLLCNIKVFDEEEREKWGEEFKAKVEDVYGLDE